MVRYIFFIVAIIISSTAYAQNLENKPDSILTYSANGTRHEKETYQYDSVGHIAVKIVDNYTWKTRSKYTYQNSDKGLPLTVIQYQWNNDEKKWEEYWKTVSKYDAEGNETEITNYAKNGKNWDTRITYENQYNKKKNEILSVSYHANGRINVESRTESKYNTKKKQLTSKTVYNKKQNKWKEVEYFHYKYDSDNRLEEEEYHEKKEEDNIMLFRYLYEYDEKGRIKKKTSYLSPAERKEWNAFNYTLYYY